MSRLISFLRDRVPADLRFGAILSMSFLAIGYLSREVALDLQANLFSVL